MITTQKMEYKLQLVTLGPGLFYFGVKIGGTWIIDPDADRFVFWFGDPKATDIKPIPLTGFCCDLSDYIKAFFNNHYNH